MFVNFNDIFNDDKKSQFKIPREYIEFLNKDLPKGIKYVADKDNNYIEITSDGEIFKVSGIEFCPNETQKKILGHNYNQNDLLNYAYNSQQKIEINTKEKGIIILNDKKFEIAKLKYNPLNPSLEVINEKIYLIPSKLDCKILIKLSNENYSRELVVSRIPNNSINIVSFKSRDDEPLKINYNIDLYSKDVKMNISYDLKYAKSIKDVVESIDIYNSFIDGKGYLCDNLIGIKVNAQKFDENSAIFWKKLLMIENYLNIKFIPPQDNIDYEEVLEIEELYQSLIMKKPFKYKNIISNINAQYSFNQNSKINDLLDKSFLLDFCSTYSKEIFGQEIKLVSLYMLFNSKIVKIENNLNNANFILEDESESKKRYISIMYFKNEKELNKYREQLNDEKIQLFKEAKSAYEYLNK